jgi:tRNA threonylcarbamoyladenosine modification (KEOPS) complex  Pcc1 subunit
MNLTLELKFIINDKQNSDLFKIILADIDQNFQRSKIKVENNNNNILIKINSTDVIALKASFSSIIKLLEIYEKTGQICKEDAKRK